MEMQGTIVREYTSKTAGKSSPEEIDYSLYFKSLIREETMGLSAGFGVAICRQEDGNLLFQMKGSLHDSAITVLEAELTALKRGLTQAVHLGITHISIYIDQLEIYELIMGSSVPDEQHNVALLMDDVQRIRHQLTSTIPVFVTRDQVKFAYELAMETLVSESSIVMPPTPEKKTCGICFNDDFETEQMLYVGLCGHQYCMACVKQYINMRLLEGSVMKCPHYRCQTNLTLTNCANLLTPKHLEMWERRIEEESILVADRVYCPDPRCSALMSVTGISNSTKEDGSMRCCFKCSKPFCINCKVPWHSDLLCDDYKRLGPNPTENDMKLKLLANQELWRQCEKCKHIIERSEGCIKMICKCGYLFCYTCGAEWKVGGCRHRERYQEDGCAVCAFVLAFVVAIVVITIIYARSL